MTSIAWYVILGYGIAATATYWFWMYRMCAIQLSISWGR
ncbi:hypothetical protein Pan265_02710 [Mucisphaera calidilacus]|uniref:Uncharacterized protein n=1 Tax=Mucisphaera calidilacus TaxID=2527982 RepID=A0A518BU08_9BACT|nr:hypothetical protein Pan265_02710 [Mucisphaera calidilacus]